MSAPPTAVADVLRGRYAIQRELGRGGMATVYLARDLKHDRLVALKVMHPELGAALGPARFLQEIRVTARLQHPHILPLLDSGEADGVPYYIMPYVEGESLRSRVRREKQLPLEHAIRIAREVALALDYAHREGIVHRDIKPENILLSDDQALVADFGVARAIEAASPDRVTATGIAVGTPFYMSPEQAGGEADLDGRSDIYSLGCVLYEMLAGSVPFSGSSARAIAARHSLDPLPSVRVVRPTVGDALERAIHRAMAKVPADRFATAGEFAEALAVAGRQDSAGATTVSPAAPPARARRFGGLLVAGGVAAVIAAAVAIGRGGAEPRARITSLAVLPVATDPTDTTVVYLGEGLTETVMNNLAGIDDLRVTARSAVARYRGEVDDPARIGRELGVQAVLAWGLRRQGDRLQVEAELVKVADGSRLWGDRYDRPLAGIASVEQDLAQAVARQLNPPSAGSAAGAAVKQATTSPEAFELYSRARFLLNRGFVGATPDTVGRDMAREYFEQALAKDPAFALAWSGLAEYYSIKAFQGGGPKELWDKAESMVRRALAIDSTSGDAWADLGIVLTYGHQDSDGAGRAFERAVALGSTHPEVHWVYGEWLLLRGRFQEAIARMQRAVEVDPVDFNSNLKLGWALLIARRYEGAIAQLKKTLELRPNDWVSHRFLAIAYERTEMLAEAAAETQKSLLISGDTAQATRIAKAYAARGSQGYWEVRRAVLLDTLAELHRRARQGDEDVRELIWTYAQLGDREHAFELLGRQADDAEELRSTLLFWNADSLRSDPRFPELMRKAGLRTSDGER